MPFGFGKKKGPEPAPDSEAPGWDAIEAALSVAFPGQTPAHWGTNALPGQGIYGLSAYRDGDGWLVVTYGLSELFAKESDDPDTSGYGFELTIRTPPAAEAPGWALGLLRSLGSSVFSSGRTYGDGHRVDVRQPITGGDPPTQLSAIALTTDPMLGEIDTPNGHVEFLRLVGITADELDQMKAKSTASVLAELAAANPALVTDPARWPMAHVTFRDAD